MNKLVVKQTFGLNSQSLSTCMCFAEDHQLAYVAGHQVVVLNTETKEQNFINISNQQQQNYVSTGISAIAASLPRRAVAIAETTDNIAVVALYDSHSFRRKKAFNFNDVGSKEIISISFSDDGRLCVTQGGAPEWNLVLWNVEKNVKIISSTKASTDEFPVNKVSICPTDSNSILAIGKQYLKLYRYSDAMLRQSTLSVRRDHANFTSYAWLDNDYLVVGTEGGEIFLLENFEYRCVLMSTTSGLPDDICPIYSLIASSTGFFAGSRDEFYFFEKSEAKEIFSLQSTVPLQASKGKIMNMVLSSDDVLTLALDKQQLLQTQVSGMLRGTEKEENIVVEDIFSPFHRANNNGDAGIIGIDVAMWRPVIATTGKDKTLRIFNYTDRTQELVKQYEEEPVSVTIHPSALYVVVGFLETIKIEALHRTEIVEMREIAVRNCTMVKFSHGGHIFAASNGSIVQVYDLFTGNNLATLRGHTNKVKCITWMNHDSKLVTVGAEGCVYNWNLFPVAKNPEAYTGMIPFQGGSSYHDGSRAYAATAERTLKEISFAKSIDPTTGLEGGIKEPRDIPVNYQVSTVFFDSSRRLLLVGSNDEGMPGCINTYMTVPQLSASYESSIIHSGAITAICMSHDCNYIFTGDSHGIICVSELDTQGAKGQGKQREGLVSFDFIDEVIITKSELEKKKKYINELTSRVEELTLNNEHQLRLKEMDHKSKVNDITTKFTSQLRIESDKYQLLLTEKNNVEQGFISQLENLAKKQSDEIKSTEAKYKTKINAESNRQKQLMEETEETHKRWNDENRALVESHQRYLQELSDDYEEKLRSEKTLQKKLQLEQEDMKLVNESARGLIDNDADDEIDELKQKYESRLKHEEDVGVELMGQHAMMKKNLQLITKDVDHQKEEIKRLRDKELRLNDNIRALEKDIQAHKKEIREREETITDKEKRIFDLKKKNQELEKFRFVLDYKIKELKLQIAPREAEIATMRKQIEEMDLELEQYHKSNTALKLMIGELKLKLDGLAKEYVSAEERINNNTRYMDRYKLELKELWDFRDENSALKIKLVKIFRDYVQNDDGSNTAKKSGTGVDSQDPQQIYNRDREQMERSLDSLRRALKSDALALKRDRGKMMREAVYLTNELNTLRKDYRTLMLQKKAVDQSGGINRHNLPELIDILGIPKKRPKTPPKTKPGLKKPNSANPAEIPLDLGEEESKQISAPIEQYSANSRYRQRSAAMRTVSANGRMISVNDIVNTNDNTGSPAKQISKADQWEAWREIQMQNETINKLEEEIRAMCFSLNMDADPLLQEVEEYL